MLLVALAFFLTPGILMIKQRIIFIFAFTLFGILVYAQGDSFDDKKELEWNEFYKLTWHDFQGQPTPKAAGDAGASVKIIAKPYLVKNKARYDVYVVFNRDKSWKRDEAPQLLAHEQLHFDLAELYARMIRKRIQELNDQGVHEVKTLNKAIQQLLEESNNADRQYDIETLHGALDQKQEAWSKRIKQELEELKAYKKQKQFVARSGE